MALENDPRLKHPSHYDRDAIVAVVRDFWDFLSSMPPYEKSDVLVPELDGWPNITETYLAPFGKNTTVVDLLKHLPYLNTDTVDYNFAPSTKAIDFRSQKFEKALQTQFKGLPGCWYIPPHGPFPDWVVPITSGVVRGEYALLDTTDGTITRQVNAMGDYEPTYADDDPRKWRDSCTDDTMPAAEYFRGLKDCFKRLEFVPHWRRGRFDLSIRGEQVDIHDQIAGIYRKHGWPDHFNREDCKADLLEWDVRQQQAARR